MPQGLKTPITYEAEAVRVDKVLADLSTKAGMTLRGSATTNPMFVMVHVKDAPLEMVLKNLADATESEWVKEENGMALSRTPAVIQRLEREDFTRKLKRVETGMAKLREAVAKQSPFDEQTAENVALRLSEFSKRQNGDSGEFDQGAYQAVNKIQREMPFGRSAERLALLFDNKTLAGLPDRGRVVFSTQPNRSQRPFPPGLQGELSRLMKEQATFVEALKRHPLNKREGGYYWDRRNSTAFTMPERVLARCSSFGGRNVSFEFILIGPKNKVLARASATMSPEGPDNESMEKIRNLEGGEKLDISGDFKVISEAIKPLFGDSRGKKIEVPQELLQKVLNPEKFEPATMTAGPLMLAYAKAKKRNSVIVLGDPLVAYSTWVSFFGEPTTARLESALGQVAEFKDENGWVSIGNFREMGGGMQYLPRDILGLLVRSEYSGKRLNIWQKIQIAPRIPGQMYETILMLWQALASGKMDYNDQSNWETIRLLASFDQSQFQAMRAGREIPLGQLSGAAQAEVRKLVFNGYGGFEREYEGVPMEEGQEAEEQVMMYDDLGDEATELFPDGLNADAKVTLTVEEKDALFGERSKSDENDMRYAYEDREPIDENRLAWQTISKERADLFPWAANQPSYDRFVMGKFTRITVRIKFRPKLAMSRQVQERDIPKNGKRLTLNDLPEAFRKKYEEQLKSYRDSYKDAKPGDFGGGGGRVIPPR